MGVTRGLRSENVEPKKSPCKKPQSTTGMVKVFDLAAIFVEGSVEISIAVAVAVVVGIEPKLELCLQLANSEGDGIGFAACI